MTKGKELVGMTFKAENGIADLIKDNKGDAKSIHNTVITGLLLMELMKLKLLFSGRMDMKEVLLLLMVY